MYFAYVVVTSALQAALHSRVEHKVSRRSCKSWFSVADAMSSMFIMFATFLLLRYDATAAAQRQTLAASTASDQVQRSPLILHCILWR
jgi:hypothetical protein